MKQQTSPTDTGVPPAFLNRFGDAITGVLSGFDRLRLRGTLRHLFQPTVMEAYLNACRILIKDFGTFAQGLTARIKAAAYASAEQSGRPFRYLSSSQISKEALARQIARRDGVTSGLIAIFSTLENCLSYSVRGNRQTKHLHMVLEPRKCLHFYHYFQHAEICRPIRQTYYWTASASEYATDLLFRDASSLAALYPRLVHHGLRTFASPDVMRFLGRKIPTQSGRVHAGFQGEVISDLKHRPEGMRI